MLERSVLVAKKEKKIVNITKDDEKSSDRYGKDKAGKIIKLEDKGDYKERAKKNRIIAIILWVIAIIFEIIGILRLSGVINWFPKLSVTVFLVICIILDLACFIPGSMFWKKANHIDPVSEKNKLSFWTINNLGTILSVLAFLPLIIFVLTNKDIDKKDKTIVTVVAAIAFKWIYAGEGILNYLLSLFNISPIGWLTDTNWALFSVAVVTIWKGIGYYMMIYLASLMSVPQDLYEACDIDGAGFIKKHLTVTVPHIMPTIALVSTISTISAMKVFAEIYVMTKGGPLDSSKTIVYYIYERAFENLDLGYASALAVVLLIVVMIFSLINILCFEKNKYGDI